MNKDERAKVKQIDDNILVELTKKLELSKDKIDIVSEEEIEKIFRKIDEKKRAIFSLFQGDFSINEKNISDRMSLHKSKSSLYDRIANNIISRRVEKIFNKIMSSHEQDDRTICTCIDRELFIKKILSENVQEAFIKKYIEKDEIDID